MGQGATTNSSEPASKDELRGKEPREPRTTKRPTSRTGGWNSKQIMHSRWPLASASARFLAACSGVSTLGKPNGHEREGSMKAPKRNERSKQKRVATAAVG